MNLLLIILLSYFLGSLPTAYLFSRWFYREDIRSQGSGNVGTLNFLRVTRSKFLAVLVLLIDAGKGFLAMWASREYAAGSLLIFPALAVICGHIFPVWLKGRGGRGLATLAGVFLFVKAAAVGIWLVIFGVLYLLTKKYILSGVAALFLINIFIAYLWGTEIFLVSSAASVLVAFKYIPRLKQELSISQP